MNIVMDENIEKELMLATFEVAQNSTCARRRVGAIIANPTGSMISTGWNHSTNGISCEAKFFSNYVQSNFDPKHPEVQEFLQMLQKDPLSAHEHEKYLSPEVSSVWESFKVYTKTPEFKKVHWDFMGQEIHSEVHAILNALRNNQVVENCVLFSSRSPCEDCAKAILEVGIKKVYYTEVSEKGLSGGLRLLDSMIEIVHLPVETTLYT